LWLKIKGMTTKICYNEDKSKSLSIQLCTPEAGEECPITSETMGSPSFVPPYSKPRTNQLKRAKLKHNFSLQQEAFSEHPQLFCAQMALCNHRFDARALLIHFMSNAMNCPICRAGHGNIPLAGKTSFPEERWICEMEEAIQEEARKEKNNQINDDIMFAVDLETADYYYSLPSIIQRSLMEHRVSVSFFFFNTPTNSGIENDYPIHGMQFDLELLPLQARHRDLSQGISLYSSFSSSSITTPPDRPSLPLLQSEVNAANNLMIADDNHNNIHNNQHLQQSATADNEMHFIMIGGHVLSLDDISVQYAMSESTLR
jgi:hypothetical protein